MKKGFTLVELLVVIGIMGLLGTVSVGGYRAMQRGMAERGVMDNVNHFIRAAYQRAQIDRQPTAIFFWNETLRQEDDYSAPVVIGKAVAIRRSGRITKVDGQLLYDEFADLERSFATDDNTAGGIGDGSAGQTKATMYLYPIDKLSDIEDSSAGEHLPRSIVEQRVTGRNPLTPLYLSGNNGVLEHNDSGNAYRSGETLQKGNLKSYAFKLSSDDPSQVNWESGMAYGFEFAELELPHGYIFGSTYSDDIGKPVRTQGTLVFEIGACTGNGIEGSGGVRNRSGVISVSSLRPGDSGAITTKEVGTSRNPTEDL